MTSVSQSSYKARLISFTANFMVIEITRLQKLRTQSGFVIIKEIIGRVCDFARSLSGYQ